MTEKHIVGWSYQRIIDRAHTEIYEQLADNMPAALDVAEGPNDSLWKITLFFDNTFTQQEIIAALTMAEQLAGQPPSAIALKPVEDEDWYAAMRRSFPPMEIGSFYIHGFEDEQAPEDKIGMFIPAGMAFGTGEHATTALCLELYEELPNAGLLQNGLDMGAGSGILAIAAALKNDTPFLAVDIEDESVAVCQENVDNNNVTARVHCAVGDGFKSADVQQKAPFDIIFANILRNPLIEMAASLTKALEVGGYAILSGFTHDQVDDVRKAYGAQGLKHVKTVGKREWNALLLQK